MRYRAIWFVLTLLGGVGVNGTPPATAAEGTGSIPSDSASNRACALRAAGCSMTDVDRTAPSVTVPTANPAAWRPEATSAAVAGDAVPSRTSTVSDAAGEGGLLHTLGSACVPVR